MLNLPWSYWYPLGMSEAPIEASYIYAINWLSLTENGYSLKNFKFDNINEINTYNRPLTNGRGLLSSYLRGRSISFDVMIKWDTKTEFLERLDKFRKAIYTKEANFDRLVWDKIRRIKVNCTTAPVNFEHYNNTWGKFSVSFETAEEVEYELVYWSVSFDWKTSNFREEITNKWTEESFPRVYFFFNTADWTNQVKLNIWDNEIEVNEDIEDWDTLVFDCDEQITKLNGTEVEWDWDIPYLDINSNFLDFSINWTYNVNILLLYKIKYV